MMDSQILRDLFASTIKAAAILGKDEAFRNELASARSRLAPNRIGGGGHLQEWLEDWDLQAPERHHRHVSHLYGLYPGRDIHRRDTPDLAAAVAKSLDLRGDRATGWATAWRIGLWTHLGDGDRAHRILSHLISPGLTYPNLFDAHPPFQIDGNFGGAACIAEMLMQSRLGTVEGAIRPTSTSEIELLPALPKAWPAGSVRGLRARGGHEVDLKWRDGTLDEAVIRAPIGGSVRLIHGSIVREIVLKRDESFRWDGR
jgi:alpha-L-fucosidase 2